MQGARKRLMQGGVAARKLGAANTRSPIDMVDRVISRFVSGSLDYF
jgi:hypothetical protein